MLDAILRTERGPAAEGARPEWLDKLTGSETLRAAIASPEALASLLDGWGDANAAYAKRRVDLYG